MLKLVIKQLISRNFISSFRSSKSTDIIIIGAGPTGLTLAAAIKQSPHLSHLSTTIIENSDLSKIDNFYKEPPKQYHNRIVNLNANSKAFLENVAKIKLLEDRIQKYDGLYVADGCSNGILEMKRDNMGYIMEIINIQSSILKKLAELQPCNLEIIDNAKVSNIKLEDEKYADSLPIVELSDGRSFKTRLLIGADGKNSLVRKFASIESRGWSYNQWGIVGNLKLEYPPYKLRGWQRFLTTGPIAHLPMPGQDAALTWTTTEEMSKLLISIDSQAFCALVNAAFVLEDIDMKYYITELQEGTLSLKNLIEDIEQKIEENFRSLQDDSMIDEKYPPKVIDVLPNSRARFPLSMANADTYISNRIALIGDAAHSTHPLAGQGLNMGQGDAESLVKTLEKAALRGLDIGSKLSLEPYWSNRYPINTALINGADTLNKIFSTNLPLIVALRTYGLNIIDKLEPVNNLIMDAVSGFR